MPHENVQRPTPHQSNPFERLMRRYQNPSVAAAPVITVCQEDPLPVYEPTRLPTYESLLLPPPYQRTSN
ncbi:hypothetical protein K7432_010512 [Basidiobolus ranarum]|uniref:Uncharacterized protein n=1 Tax=Basidiobolus ranarum TaxID=34480 RepID=A0ABR2WNM0_9FUNG